MRLGKNRDGDGHFVLEMDECEALALIGKLVKQIDYAKHFKTSLPEQTAVIEPGPKGKGMAVGYPQVLVTIVNRSKE